ncbi:MAG: hypothetical protein AB7G06_04155 [Bdellovibrionales bacterium]
MPGNPAPVKTRVPSLTLNSYNKLRLRLSDRYNAREASPPWSAQFNADLADMMQSAQACCNGLAEIIDAEIMNDTAAFNMWRIDRNAIDLMNHLISNTHILLNVYNDMPKDFPAKKKIAYAETLVDCMVTMTCLDPSRQIAAGVPTPLLTLLGDMYALDPARAHDTMNFAARRLQRALHVYGRFEPEDEDTQEHLSLMLLTMAYQRKERAVNPTAHVATLLYDPKVN